MVIITARYLRYRLTLNLLSGPFVEKTVDCGGLFRKSCLKSVRKILKNVILTQGLLLFFPSQYIFNSNDAGISDSYIGCVLDKYKSIDIDNMDDWKHAEYLMNAI